MLSLPLKEVGQPIHKCPAETWVPRGKATIASHSNIIWNPEKGRMKTLNWLTRETVLEARREPRPWIQPVFGITGGFPGGAVVKTLPANAGDIRDVDLMAGLESSPGGGNGNPFQYSRLRNPMDRGAGQATVQGSQRSDTTERLSTHTPVRSNN